MTTKLIDKTCQNSTAIIDYFENRVTTNGRFQAFNEEVFKNMKTCFQTYSKFYTKASEIKTLIEGVIKINAALKRGSIFTALRELKIVISHRESQLPQKRIFKLISSHIIDFMLIKILSKQFELDPLKTKDLYDKLLSPKFSYTPTYSTETFEHLKADMQTALQSYKLSRHQKQQRCDITVITIAILSVIIAEISLYFT